MGINWGQDGLVRVEYDERTSKEHAMNDNALDAAEFEALDYAHHHPGGLAEWPTALFAAYRHRSSGTETCYFCRRVDETT